MKFQWTRNMLGQTLEDEEMRVIKYPCTELTTHVTFKTIQAFALLGMVAVGPAVRGIRGPRNLQAIIDTAVNYGKYGAVLGAAAGPAMTYARVVGGGIDEDGLYDRCYRLRYNRNQVRTDRLAFLGTLGGAAGAMAMGGSLSSGAVIGLVGGTVLAGVYNSAFAAREK
ncbi:predicted protein [Nematostella vectensis]|uniref:Uncharacterized protein n=1 Tax=Nematostella vectensis TaxID=45351 RepID=A7RQZ2_NEMVE|nr:uncharacterized protein LOC5518114 [Nematostella vectensis]EDO46076.1 predicted protein [Nematostella vectensis]|eukprot:XP_001638139.1 predicted protein [Nematostella vectensis]